MERVRVESTYRLADTCVARLIDATYEHSTCEGDVEAEVDQHVPALTADADGPEVRDT